MSWNKSCKIKVNRKNIIIEYTLEPILSSTPIKNIEEGDKVRINTTDVRTLLLAKGHTIGQCLESPPQGEIRNYFYEDSEEYILGRWVFENPAPLVKKEKKVKKKVAIPIEQ